ncbi:MAG TPA: crosslink repair DNA glycosylase YcaQ family protein, partial [Planctomycetota bacterium]|nr:crosslink repair DNA glycosylase YcaQ family protein [Planctomycetota bacterium]
MASTASAATIPLAQARAAFFAAQGIPPAGKPAILPALDRIGFVRTLGGIDVYLAVRARVPGLSRADLDRAVDRHEAQVLPSVRGCIYLVPRRDAAVALRAADLLSRGRAEREHQKAGIKPGEVAKVAQAVLAALKKAGPSTTDALRRALPGGVVRSLGEAGKKVGISSPLPPALRLLEFEGKVERTLEGGRLDTERYLWRAAARSPFEGARVPEDPIDLWARLGEIFFRAAGLGTLKSFAEWAGISLRDATAAAGKLPLASVSIEGVEDPHLVLETERRALLETKGTDGAVSFLPFEDNLLALRGGPAILVDPAF